MPVFTYALDSPADCFAVVEEKKLRSSRVVFNLDDELVEARLRLIGRHNVYNALAAAAAARKLGADADAIAQGISLTREVGRAARMGGLLPRGGYLRGLCAHAGRP